MHNSGFSFENTSTFQLSLPKTSFLNFERPLTYNASIYAIKYTIPCNSIFKRLFKYQKHKQLSNGFGD